MVYSEILLDSNANFISLSLLIPLIFISLRGESALNVIIDNSLFLLLSILSIIALINISLLIHQSSGNYVLPILTAIVGVVVGRFLWEKSHGLLTPTPI